MRIFTCVQRVCFVIYLRKIGIRVSQSLVRVVLIEDKCLTVFLCYYLYIHDKTVRHLAQCSNGVFHLHFSFVREGACESGIAHIESLFIIGYITA